MEIRLKRAYDPPAPDDGLRVLVDRLWPRGVMKEDLALDEWPKEITPSNELRRSWHADLQAHEPEHFAAFAAAYRAELTHDLARDTLTRLISRSLNEHRPLTLVYGAKNRDVNHAVVLREVLLSLPSNDCASSDEE